jgi:hypothetical protein
MTLRRDLRRPSRLRAEIAWCLLGLAVFLLLPTLRFRHFGRFYRPVEVRQSAGRHSFLAAPIGQPKLHQKTDRWEPVAREPAAPPVPSHTFGSDLPPQIPIARILMRPKISAAADRSDPDLFA